jgi:hypothetical protein
MVELIIIIAYLLIGKLALAGMVIVHIAKAELKGYDASNSLKEYIDSIEDDRDENRINDILVNIYCTLFWPVRLFEFTVYDTKRYYEMYPRK